MKTYLYYFTTLVSIVLISMGCEKEMMDYNERIELIEKARELVRYMRKRTDISFRIGIGGPRMPYILMYVIRWMPINFLRQSLLEVL